MTTKESPLDVRKILAGVIVTVLGGFLLKLTSDAIPALFGERTTPTVSSPTAPPTETPPPPEPSSTPSVRFFDFAACLEPCDAGPETRTFPEGTWQIFFRWNHAGIPPGAHYVRSWTMDGLEWVRYDCAWDGPSAGTEEIRLYDEGGLHSGTWEITVTVDGQVVMRESVIVEGDNAYWDPAGVINACRRN
jgi:hypothetical protein